MDFDTLRGLLLLALGFGFVIFWHELGHFLAAKWAGVKVEQFAVGFGQALIAWRKGLGFSVGTSAPAFNRRVDDYLREKAGAPSPSDASIAEAPAEFTEMQRVEAARALGISETEYRLNWIPLGGYVKMLGQDDLRPNSEDQDPRAFNRQSIGKRMVIVSAGVIMNIILAGFGFMVLFLIGFRVAPAEIGSIIPGSPAQQAGLRVGDRVVSMDGRLMHKDWTKIQLNSALSKAGETIPVVIERGPEKTPERLTLQATPQRAGGPSKDFVSLGIGQATSLRGPEADKKASGRSPKEIEEEKQKVARLMGSDFLDILPGDVITAINGKPVEPDDYPTLDAALQRSNGQSVALTVRNKDGVERPEAVRPRLTTPFGDTELNFAGMVPRVRIGSVMPGSSGAKQSREGFKALMPGDVVTAVGAGPEGAEWADPSFSQFQRIVSGVEPSDRTLKLTVRRDGQELVIGNLTTIKIRPGTYGLGVGQGYDEMSTVVAEVLPDSPAQAAKIPQGARVVAVGGQGVETWHDVRRQIAAWTTAHAPGTPAAAPLPIAYVTRGGDRQQAALDLTPAAAMANAGLRYHADLALDAPKTMRQADSAVQALKWGVTETRDFVLQFYLTLRRMVSGDVSPKNMMGPVGIFQAGTNFANRGGDWLLWFLAMISANLAVVNFLPIPIVDGGLFTFLVLEKIKGKPLSPRTQAFAQHAGLLLLGAIFLFVTYQDLTNFQFR